MSKDYPLTAEEFETIYSKVPRLTVEVIVQENGAIFLSKRSIEPCKGQWHIPGGTVYFGEALLVAVRRIAKRELKIDVERAVVVGYVEYPSHYENGLDSPVGIVFRVASFDGEIMTNSEATDSGWFKKAPKNMHADQDKFLLEHNYLEA